MAFNPLVLQRQRQAQEAAAEINDAARLANELQREFPAMKRGEALREAVSAIGQAVYQQQQQQPGTAPPGGPGGDGGPASPGDAGPGVIDAEFKDSQ